LWLTVIIAMKRVVDIAGMSHNSLKTVHAE
jgi:hypothetical protein